MRYFYLKKTLRNYLIAGMIAGVFMFLCLSLVMYKNSFANSISRMAQLTVQASRIRTETENIDIVMSHMKHLYPDIEKQRGKQALLTVVDELRTLFPQGRITIREITQDETGELILPVSMRLYGVSYDEMISVIGHMQSYLFPFADIVDFSLRRDSSYPDNRFTADTAVILRIVQP